MNYQTGGWGPAAQAFAPALAGLAALIAALAASTTSMFVGAVLALALSWQRLGSSQYGRRARVVFATVATFMGACLAFAELHKPTAAPASPNAVASPPTTSSASPPTASPPPPRLPASPPASSIPPPPPVAAESTGPTRSPPAGLQTQWATICPSDPGESSPAWARDNLHALYLGGMKLNADPPPGITGGCTGPPIFPLGRNGGVVYVEGRDPDDPDGEIKSVAIVSKRFGSAIFIDTAAKPALRLIKMYRDIGGMPRMNAGDGQVYGVKTALGGPAILMRPGTVRGDGSGEAQDYLVLRPAAAALWWRAMEEHRTWLWALPGKPLNGKRRIHLVANLITREVVKTILFDRKTGLARLGTDRSSRRWLGPVGAPINQQELESYAKTAHGSPTGDLNP
jgi:hypothetical protein